MAGRERTPVDLSGLERELLSAIEQDVRYWQQNDAKLRAINQRVPTYAEFRYVHNKSSYPRDFDRNSN